MGNIFKKKLHLSVLARLKVLILLAFVVVVGCLVAFVSSFSGFVPGWPLLHPHRSSLFSIVFMVASWILMLYYVDKGEPEQGRVGYAFWFLFVALLLLCVGFWLIFPIGAEGTPEKRGAQYVLIHHSKKEDSESDVIRNLSKEEYELITIYYVRRNAFGWMLFHGMLMLSLFYWHNKISTGDLKPIKALNPAKMNISQAILALRANAHNAEIWLRLGWMLAREGEAEYARNCYQRALSVNLSNSPSAADLLPTWLNSSLIMQHTSASWRKNNSTLNKYKGGVSLLSLMRLFNYISENGIFIAPLIAVLLILYTEGVLKGPSLLLLRAVVGMFIIRFLASVLHVLKMYLTSRSWPTTEAMVIGSFLIDFTVKRNKYYKIYFVVVYKVGDKILYSTVPSINAYDPLIRDEVIEKFKSIETARTLQDERYRFGNSTPIFYNPSQPDIILSKAGFNSDHIGAVLDMIIMVFFLAWFLYLLLF